MTPKAQLHLYGGRGRLRDCDWQNLPGRQQHRAGARLRQRYKTAGEPVYLDVQRHFSVQPSMDEGLTEKALVPDGKIAFDRSKNAAANKRFRYKNPPERVFYFLTFAA